MLPQEIESGDGRRFSLRECTPADMLDLIEAAGAAAASAAWLRYALMICSVSAIDGKPVLMPLTKNGVRELGRRIGNSGMDALAAAHYPEPAVASVEDVPVTDVAKN
ncbi:hypothetical protein [Lichenicoccus sp.]|uniref:hypothetical protein n=1 Tax=Lichenicoccus sp. TaxID=2781899 RepID=UPI003D0D6E2D